MGLPGWRLWLLGAAALLLGNCSDSGSWNRSQKTFLMAVSEPSQGLPRFVTVGYVGDQVIGDYDSVGRRIVPRVPWMEKLEKEDPQLWARQTQNMQAWELRLSRELGTVQDLYNHSGGFHTLQFMVGCELSEDGRKGGFAQYGYDGRDFVAFDKETLSWTAADAKARITKGKWDADLSICHGTKAYLEETCIEWLRKYLGYGKETPLRKEPPMVKVTHRANREHLETLLCRVHGFYPKEIDVAWRKDGEVRLEDTFRGVVSPNVDGTYYTWLSIDIDPKDRSRFRCHVDHDGLLEPLDVALEERTWPASVPPVGLLVGVLSGVVAALLLVAGIVLRSFQRHESWSKAGKHQAKAAYRAA